jgi:methyl-accepting chemotaxis protein
LLLLPAAYYSYLWASYQVKASTEELVASLSNNIEAVMTTKTNLTTYIWCWLCLIRQITDMNLQIASTAEDQSQVTEEMNRNTSNIRDLSQRIMDNG